MNHTRKSSRIVAVDRLGARLGEPADGGDVAAHVEVELSGGLSVAELCEPAVELHRPDDGARGEALELGGGQERESHLEEREPAPTHFDETRNEAPGQAPRSAPRSASLRRQPQPSSALAQRGTHEASDGELRHTYTPFAGNSASVSGHWTRSAV